MLSTIVIQSHCQPLPYSGLQVCIDSVKTWADLHHYDYEFLDDELFDYVPIDIIEKTKNQKVIATDLARLKILQKYLSKNYETVIWCDADFVIFNPDEFKPIENTYALGREVWIQEDVKKSGNMSAHVKVHNAFMMFRKGNAFLDFYTETAEKLILQNTGSMPPQFIGPKLLTALHNIAQCPVQETAGMLSPLLIHDIVNGGGDALELFKRKSTKKVYAANLCNSLLEIDGYSAKQLDDCLEVLFHQQAI